MFVTYATRDKGSNAPFDIMKNPIPINNCNTSGEVKRKFLAVFKECFGDTLECKVLGIHAKQRLTFQPERV